MTLSVKKKKKKRWKKINFFSGDQDFSPTNNFLSVTFSPEWKPNNRNIKKNYQIYYSEEKEAAIAIESSIEEKEDLHVDAIFDQPFELTIN